MVLQGSVGAIYIDTSFWLGTFIPVVLSSTFKVMRFIRKLSNNL